MNEITTFATQWGWGVTLGVATLYFLAKNWQKLADWLKSLFPFWERRQMSALEAKRFELDQKAKAQSLSHEEQERQDTIVALKDTLKLMRDDKECERQERQALQGVLIDIERERSRHDTEIAAVLQNVASLQIAHTEAISTLRQQVSDLTHVIERITGVIG